MKQGTPEGSRLVMLVRGMAEDDGARLALGFAVLLAGPQIARVAAHHLTQIGVLEPRGSAPTRRRR
jgi:hypothetical protein